MPRILFVAANPLDTTRLRVDEESRVIDQALRQAEFRHFDIEKHYAVQVAELSSLLLRYQPDIVHFSGHGSKTGEIILEDSSGNSSPVSAQALGQLFSILKDNVRCVILNACYSEEQAQAIARHVDCVIGLSDVIDDTAAIRFSASFYLALGFGKDVKTAFDLGCLQIDLENLASHNILRLLALHRNPSEIVFVDKKEAPSGVEEKMNNSKDMPRTSGVTVGNVSGGIHSSIIAGGDVSNATITVGGKFTPIDKNPTFDEFKQLLAEIQQGLDDIVAKRQTLEAISPSAPYSAQGAVQSIKDVSDKVDPHMQPKDAKSVQQRLGESIKLLDTILGGAKVIADKVGEATEAVRPLVEKLAPLIEKISVAALWATKLWL